VLKFDVLTDLGIWLVVVIGRGTPHVDDMPKVRHLRQGIRSSGPSHLALLTDDGE
jgi:hypothetical protein